MTAVENTTHFAGTFAIEVTIEDYCFLIIIHTIKDKFVPFYVSEARHAVKENFLGIVGAFTRFTGRGSLLSGGEFQCAFHKMA